MSRDSATTEREGQPTQGEGRAADKERKGQPLSRDTAAKAVRAATTEREGQSTRRGRGSH
jgi:hypothetical protein